MLKAWGAAAFMASMFWVLTKTKTAVEGVEESRTVPFLLNRVQSHLETRLARNNRVLKARQAGLTTYMLLRRLLLPIVTEGGKTGMLISQNSKYATLHFGIAHRAYRLFGALDPHDHTANELSASLRANILHTAYSNRKELVFDVLDSKIIIESAEVEEAGQGVTLHHVVASEVARWPGLPEDTTSNVKGGLVPGGTYDEESTGNGAAGYFYEQYLRSMDDEVVADARSHFYGWWWSDEYAELALTPQQAAELEADITSDELSLIAKMHSELAGVAYVV